MLDIFLKICYYIYTRKEVLPMSCIVYRTDSGGRVYAYLSESYWDKEKGQPRSKRTYLGRVNPENGEIIKGRQDGKNYKGKPAKTADPCADGDRQDLLKAIKARDAEIVGLKQEIGLLKSRITKMADSIRKIADEALDEAKD